ncbi:hypothetical protein SUGI_0648600 [Cryptomeria japonica]|nr:hypothetical protein SUGI_0648600 [Cryptomeria japonica]
MWENKDVGGEKCAITMALASTYIAKVEVISAPIVVEVVRLTKSSKSFRGETEILVKGRDYEHWLIAKEFPDTLPTCEEKEYSAEEFDGQDMVHEIGQTSTKVVIAQNGGAVEIKRIVDGKMENLHEAHDFLETPVHTPIFVMLVEELEPTGEIVGLIHDYIRTMYLSTREEEERAHVEHTVLLRAMDILPSNRTYIAFLFLPGAVVEKLQGVFERLTVYNQPQQCIDVYVDLRGRNSWDSLEALILDYLDIEFSSMLTVDAWCKVLEFGVKHSLEAELRSFG